MTFKKTTIFCAKCTRLFVEKSKLRQMPPGDQNQDYSSKNLKRGGFARKGGSGGGARFSGIKSFWNLPPTSNNLLNTSFSQVSRP